MSAHTPAPWVPRASALCVDFGIVVEGQYVIAECFSDIRQEAKTDIEEARANARLIAAAPDLLACLQAVAAGNAIGWGADIRAAIAKATGGAA